MASTASARTGIVRRLQAGRDDLDLDDRFGPVTSGMTASGSRRRCRRS
jgi:hypothetical protein